MPSTVELLIDAELDLIGWHELRPSSGGWHQPGNLSRYELDRYEELSSEDSAMLAALMDYPRADQLCFLGG